MKCYQFNNVKIKAIYLILTPNLVRWQIHPSKNLIIIQFVNKKEFSWKTKGIYNEGIWWWVPLRSGIHILPLQVGLASYPIPEPEFQSDPKKPNSNPNRSSKILERVLYWTSLDTRIRSGISETRSTIRSHPNICIL